MIELKRRLTTLRLTKEAQLEKAEAELRSKSDVERLPYAVNTKYSEIAGIVIKDRVGSFKNPLYLTISKHSTAIGVDNVLTAAVYYLDILKKSCDFDELSVGAEIKDGEILLKVLVRVYDGTKFDFHGFFSYIGENEDETVKPEENVDGHLIIPDEIKNFNPSEEEKNAHKEAFEREHEIYLNSSKEKPFLNQLDDFIPEEIPSPADHMDLIYDMEAEDRKLPIMGSYEDFISVFSEMMNYASGTEYYRYAETLKDHNGEKKQGFLQYIQNELEKKIQMNEFNRENLDIMMKKIDKALYKLYVIQDFVDDPEVTDIQITAPDSIRVRIHGKSYLSNVTFLNYGDYIRFVNAIAVRNGINLNVPEQTFTDEGDPNYILRWSVSSGYISAGKMPSVHIRKISRHKLLFDDLIEKGMLDEKIKNYLLWCGKHSRGIVFAGPPGSGKTVILNAFLEEAYEPSADILVIQENDELFTNRKGVKFQHPVMYPVGNQQPVTLEDLGKLALVNGSNIFIIGEAKGGEISAAITLSNSGCRTAITIHSPNSVETVDKMADLAMRGLQTDYAQAKRSLKSFQTIVYLKDFKVQEISEIVGYDDKKQDMIYRYIYRRDAE